VNPTITTAVASLGTAFGAAMYAVTDTALPVPVRAACAVGAAIIVAVWVFASHATEQAKISGGASVAAAKAAPAAAPDLASAIGPVLAALGGAQPQQPPA
jgi:hypothetical protein